MRKNPTPSIVWALVLVLVALPLAPLAQAGHNTAHIDHTVTFAGDTYVFKLQTPSGGGFKILAGSTITVDGVYAPPYNNDVGASFTLTDLRTTTFHAIAFARAFTPGETHVEVGTHVPGMPEVHLGGGFAFGAAQTGFEWTQDMRLDKSAWYFVLSLPDAAQLDVTFDITTDKPGMGIAAESWNDAAALAGPEEFDGTAQVVTPNRAVAADMHFPATAPAGTQVFTVTGPMLGAATTGLYSISRNGGIVAASLQPDPFVPFAFVLHGAPGSYDHVVHAEDSTACCGAHAGHFAVFTAPPLPI